MSGAAGSGKYRFLTAQEYWAELYDLVSKAGAGDRVLLMTMSFEPTEPAIANLTDALFGAARRGAETTLAVDAHSFLMHHYKPGPMWSHGDIPPKLAPIYRNKLNILQDIDNQRTGRGVILNRPSHRFTLPIAGRSHIKIAIINDSIFIGGCNLQGSRHVDMMTTWKDAKTAEWLYQIMRLVIDNEHTREAWRADHRYAVDEHTDILIDTGKRGRSLILDESLALIDSAKNWLTITCQFFPNSITARHLLLARRRGVDVRVVFSHPRHHGLIGGLGQQVSILRERSRLPRELFQHAMQRTDPFLHAKLIACDQGVMIGSHNYVRAGVRLGTAEIAVLSRDTQQAEESIRTLQRALKQARPKASSKQ